MHYYADLNKRAITAEAVVPVPTRDGHYNHNLADRLNKEPPILIAGLTIFVQTW
jgi:hypothetical protein